MKLVQSRHSLRDQRLSEVRHRMLENIINSLRNKSDIEGSNTRLGFIVISHK